MGSKIHIHHIDGDPSNVDEKNLMVTHAKCHFSLPKQSRENKTVIGVAFSKWYRDSLFDKVNGLCELCGCTLFKTENCVWCDEKESTIPLLNGKGICEACLDKWKLNGGLIKLRFASREEILNSPRKYVETAFGNPAIASFNSEIEKVLREIWSNEAKAQWLARSKYKKGLDVKWLV